MQQFTGAAKMEIDIVDYSILLNTALKGKTGVLGVTERGEPGVAYEIGTWDQYKQYLGGLLTTDDFPLYCKRALESGGRLVVIPAGKYANPANTATLSGVKAFRTLTETATSAAGATTAITISAVNLSSAGAVSIIIKRPGLADVTIANNTAITSGASPTSAAALLVTAINAGTGTHGYSAANTAGVLTITAPAALGAWGRNLKASVLTTDDITFLSYLTNFTGGNDTTSSSGTFTVTAKAKGTAYNQVKIIATTAATNNPNFYDVTITLTNGDAPVERYYNIPKLATDTSFASVINAILAASELISNWTFSTQYVFQPFTTTLTGGTNGTTLSPADYVGDAGAKTNLYAFDNVTDITKICIPAIADGALAKTLADYVDARQDLIALHRTPLGISAAQVVEYRTATGSYSGYLPIDSFRSFMFTGGINVIDPITGLPRVISEIGDVIGAIAKKDNNFGEWYSFAGETRGLLKNILGVGFNVGTPNAVADADLLDVNGINPVIQNSAKKVFIAGDTTMQLESTLLSKANVAELVVFMYRSIRALVQLNYDPNDIITWKQTYRRIQPFLELLKAKRAIWDYAYVGDQDIMDISQAVVNSPANVDKGIYEARIYIKPKVAQKYIGFTIAVANSGVSFTELEAIDFPTA